MKITSKILKTAKVDWKKILPLQPKNFKDLTETAFKKLRQSIINNSFISPFVIWEHDGKLYTIDGVHRQKVLLELEREKFTIPPKLDAIFLDCKNRKEAAKLLLVYSSIYAKTTMEGFDEFLSLEGLDFEDLKMEIDIAGLNLDFMDVKETDFPELKDGDREPFQQMTFTLSDDQAETIKKALAKAKKENNFDGLDNENSNGNAFVKIYHYSGKIVNNSTLHFGAFLGDRLHGVMSFGNSLDKRKMLGLVKGTLWNEFLELNRMAFDDTLPKNSESRSLSIAFKLIKKHYPHIKWIVSFADGTQCGDGTIYRASGFVLADIKINNRLLKMPDGEITHGLNLAISGKIRDKYNPLRKSEGKIVKQLNLDYLNGYQLKYIYFFHPNEKQNLTVPILPFSKIDEMNAGMYKGKKISLAERKSLCVGSSKSEQPVSNRKDGSEILTSTLQLKKVI